MKKDLFKNEVVEELKNKLSVVPWFKEYIESIPAEFIVEILSQGHSMIDVNVKNNTVIEASLNVEGDSHSEKWKYCLAEPYPGIRILNGNITGLMKLNGIGTGIPDTKTSVIHYCVKGRCEIQTCDGMYAFMEPGVLCIESHKHKEKDFNFFGEEYEGVEISFELDTFDEESVSYLKTLGIDVEELRDRFDVNADYYIGNVSDSLKASEMELDALMKSETPDGLSLFLAILRINNLIKQGNVETDKSKFYLTKGQRMIVREVHDKLVADLTSDVTVEQLAKEKKISSVSLNKYFRIMYGDTVHGYMQDYRMKLAGKYLSHTDESVADIAAMVGYENQSKFSSAFKRKYGMTPLEHRLRFRNGANLS